eukprot:GEMP01035110.1.p1 GENE.GEMP01035110.1~~GEMP01035110.1.p1  ORF type:complete len:654 (+),score=98.06 GEMP01035110.1:33-1994(+)
MHSMQDYWAEVSETRCLSMNYHPVGDVGTNWTSETQRRAFDWCAAIADCVAVMRYVGTDNPENARVWTGTPQFCSDYNSTVNKDWITYVKPECYCPVWPECKINTTTNTYPGATIRFTEDPGFPLLTADNSTYRIDLKYIPVPHRGGNMIKRHFMSVFFLEPNDVCNGELDVQMAYEQIEEEHVFVDDGTDEIRKMAFGPYHFTILCGDPPEVLPQVLVDVFSWATSPLLPEKWHKRLPNGFFHLSDGAQAYRTVQLEAVRAYLEDIWSKPSLNDQMAYKHSFLMLQQSLLFYSYRAPVATRIRDAACEACRVENIIVTDKVRVVFAIVSARMQVERREVIRRTWGNFTSYPKYASWNFDIVKHARLYFYVGQTNQDPKDLYEPDMVELKVVESYRRMNIKVLQMMNHVSSTYPDIIFLVRADDDIYLRIEPFLWMLSHRAPFFYWWGNFDHGSSPVRDETHPHYNSYEQYALQSNPMYGDLFPIYARGSLWAMSLDLLSAVLSLGRELLSMTARARNTTWDDDALAELVPHPDDPFVGVIVEHLVRLGHNVNVDDRDFNVFSLNPSCDTQYSSIHGRTMVVHHTTPAIMDCMWRLDRVANDGEHPDTPRVKNLTDLCECGVDVVEEFSDWYAEESGQPFWYPRLRFSEHTVI